MAQRPSRPRKSPARPKTKRTPAADATPAPLRERDAAELLAALVGSSVDGVLLCDAEQRIVYANAAVERAFGWTPAELVGRPLETLIPERFRSRHREWIESFRTSGGPRPTRLGPAARLGLTKDGREIPLDGTIGRLDQGGRTFLTVVHHDRREDLPNLARGESGGRLRDGHFETMLEGYAYCRMIFDAGVPVDYVHLDANPAYRALTGLPDPVGRRISELIPGIREANPELFEAYGRVATSGAPVRFETYVPALDRTYRISAWRPEPECFAVFFEDVSEERRTARELARREEMLREVTDGATDVLWTLDLDLGRFLYVSPSIRNLRGFTPEEVMAAPFEAGLTPDSRDLVRRELAARSDQLARGDGDPAVLVVEEICRDGSTIWTELTARARRNPANGHLEIHGVSRDVTARRRAEADREEAARFSRAVLDGLGAHVAVVDEAGSVLATNESWRRFARDNGGEARACLEGANYLDVCDRAAAAGDAGAADFASGLRGVLAGRLERFEQEYACDSPEVKRWFLARATPFPGAGPRRVVVSHEDITARLRIEAELRRQQELLRDAGEMAHLGGWEFDPASGEGSWTDETMRIHDVGPEDPVTVAHGLEFYRGESKKKIDAAVAAAIAEGTPYDLELELVSAQGVAKWVRTIGRPELRDGRVVRVSGSIQDLTERKRAEVELQRSEAQLRLALEAANQGLWDFDVVTGEESVSPEYASMLGYDPAQFRETDEAWLERMHPDDRAPVLASLRACLEDELPEYRVEFRQRSAAGEWRWILSLGRIVERDPEGRPLRMLGTHTDVTDRKLAEERVRASEARLRLALEAANQGLWDLDVTTGEAVVSPEYASMLGFDPARFRETNQAWIARLHPDDAERVAGVYRDYVAGRIPEYRVEFRQRTAAGDWKWILSLGRAVERDAEGAPLRMLGTHTDITDRKAAEAALAAERAQLRTVIDTIPDPVWLKSEAGRFLACNAAFERLAGAPEAEVLGRTDHDLFDRETADFFRERDGEAIRSGAARTNEEWVTYAASGQRVLLETTKVPVPRPGGGVLGVLGIGRDVTEARRTAEALRQSEERLRLFVEYAPAAIAMLDREMRYMASSRRWRTDYGLAEAELTGRGHYEVFPEIGATWRAVHQRCLAGEVVSAEEDRFERADGSVQWLHWEVRPWHDSAGEVAGILIFSEDITARKEAAIALARSELHYRALAETTFDWIWEVDADARYTFVSPRVTELLGYAPEEVIGRTPFDLMPEAESARVREIFAGIAARREPFAALENVNRHRSGRSVVLESSGVPFFGPDGEFRGYRGMDRDITARKQAERRLATQAAVSRVLAEADSLESAARGVLEAIGRAEGWQVGGLWIVDPEREVISCAEVWREEGFDAERLERQSRSMLLRRGEAMPGRVWASGRPETNIPFRPGARLPRGEAAAEAGLQGAVAFAIASGDKVLGVVEFGGTSMREIERSTFEMLEGLGRQLGQFLERRRAEEAVARFVAGSPGVTYALRVLPEGFRLVWVGGNLEAISGWTLEQARAESWWVDHLHPDDRARIVARDILSADGDRETLEFRFRRPDGSYFWVHDERRLLRDGEGRPAEVIGSWTEITDRVRLEEQLRTAQKLEAIGRLAGGVAHDFNNLLTVIAGNGELLARALAPEGPEQMLLGEIRDASDRAAALTRQLLAFSRSQVLTPQLLELNAAVERTEGMLRRLIGEDIELVCTLAPDTGWVRVDPGQLEQVIVNLAVNARDAMPRGGRLELASRAARLDAAECREHPGLEPGRYAALEVRDTGIGMSPEVVQRIFEPFFTTKGPGAGTGLGLATVHGVVAQSGGRIEVESEVGRGTTFTILLPSAAAPAAAAAAAPAPAATRGHETVLLVEDEEGVRRIARIALEARGYRVLAASSGRAAVGLAEAPDVEIDLLVTDLVMPGMSGRELADELRARRPGLRVLFISGYVEDELARHGIVEAEVAFLHKPFSLAELGAKVREVLDAPPPAAAG